MIESGIAGISGSAAGADAVGGLSGAQTTGRYIVVFADEADNPSEILSSAAGVSNVASSGDFEGANIDFSETQGADAVVFEEIGMAVVSAEPSQLSALATSAQAQGAIIAVAPELIHHIMEGPLGYVHGYRDGVTDLVERLGAETGGTAAAAQAPGAAGFNDTPEFTWGLQATKVSTSPRSGLGIKVAVLDTGFDSTHPDFVGRTITTQSFIAGETPQDGHGHGTHCIGTSCGPKQPTTGRRYGIAYEAEIFAGKVLSNAGSGSDAGILAGINWAVTNGCHVISMSLGADVPQVHPPYTTAGRRALKAGTLIVAAAGNNANRPLNNGFVGVPANSPYIMAIAALDKQEAVAFFSARTLPVRGGQVDVAGPGVQVYSSWLMPQQYNTISGTSMATPHSAGVAALWAQATGFRARELWAVMAQESKRLVAPSVDVGGGTVIAPQ